MAERVNSFVGLDDLEFHTKQKGAHPPVDAVAIEQIADDNGFTGGGSAKPQEPQPTTPLQTLLKKSEQTKLTSFNLPLSMRLMLKEISEATGATMTEVLVKSSRPVLDQWVAEVRSRKPKRREM
jgi:hypothetical protein